jgi:hypothetical protein
MRLSLVLAMGLWLSSPAIAGEVYPQEYHETHTTAAGLPSDDVTCVAVSSDGDVYAGTARGLARFDGTRWEHFANLDEGPIRSLAAGADGTVYAISERVMLVVKRGRDTRAELLPRPLSGVSDLSGFAVVNSAVGHVGTSHGLYRLDLAEGSFNVATERGLHALLGEDRDVRQVAVATDGRVAVAANAGLFLKEGERWRSVRPTTAARSWAPRDVRGVAFDAEGRLWFASPQGVGVWDGTWRLFTGYEGLPYNDFTGMAVGGDGAAWFGTKLGAIRYDGARWAYRQGLKWLPDDGVRDVAVSPSGDAWFATAKGVGRIGFKPMTFAEKAAYYEQEVEKYHRRTEYGYVLRANLETPGEKGTAKPFAADNDGLWTSLYGAVQSFAYATTGRTEYKARAKAAFEAARFLSQAPQGTDHSPPPGFPARSVVPTSEPDPNNEIPPNRDRDYKENDALWKILHPRWLKNADDTYYWKCDTSSDELSGHYFLYAMYYDLAAESEEEKERVRAVVRAMTDHLIEHNFTLVDWDGTPTRWANYGPDKLNHDYNWWAERGLASLSILSHLAVAEHVTGDAKYGRVAKRLIEEEHYAMNVMFPKQQNGPGSFTQHDDHLAFLGYYPLLRYETDPDLRAKYAASCRNYWELERFERNPWFNFLAAASCTGATASGPFGTSTLELGEGWLEDAVFTLQRYPLDLVDWKHTNSHRLDLVPMPSYRRSANRLEGRGMYRTEYNLPVDERVVRQWSRDPWTLDTGTGGTVLMDGTPFLMAYYLGLYHGYLEE